MKTKSYFVQPTLGQIKRCTNVREASSDLVNQILNLQSDDALIIKRRLIPEEHENSRKFMKHAAEVKTKRFRSLEEAVKTRRTPVQLREEAFDNLRSPIKGGYSFKPFVGNDKRTRRISLVECLEGTKLYCYVNPENLDSITPSITVKPYDDAVRVEREGAEVIVKVPSRMKKASRYEFKVSSVTVADTKNKWGTAYNISTDHDCQSKRFNIRYACDWDKESSKVFNFCAHEVAAYLAIVDHYWTEKKNVIPLQMSQFAIPSKETVDYYNKLCKNCLIQEDGEKARTLNHAEKEILLWGLVKKFGHDNTFFAKDKVRDYKF
ncbi:hypothetical protein HOA91_02120 [Candidatus Woesearchaeota archaeon]|jgi:hypothetical protein|nr:hypothetical protein [Candidatus Woesearchaeota archaeon]